MPRQTKTQGSQTGHHAGSPSLDMVVDLHSHYPMHLKATPKGRAIDTRKLYASNSAPGDWLRQLVFELAQGLFNTTVVTIDSLRKGSVMVSLSVLLKPFAEIDLSVDYGAPPEGHYFSDLLALIGAVEKDVKAKGGIVAHDHLELADAIANNQVALIHAIEGGFLVGATPDEVRDNVRTLAARGVAYITVAHLFFRQVATNAPAIPAVTDTAYHCLCPQPPDGLQELGFALIDEMVNQRILIDITHMSYTSIQRTLDHLDPSVPVIATHAACALTHGAPEYNIRPEHVRAVADRGGVIGLIACEHWMTEGAGAKPKNLDQTMALIFRHIDFIRDATGGSYDYIGIGSDMDGFIRPTLKGLKGPATYKEVRKRLIAHYQQGPADQICFGNALRVLQWWRPLQPETSIIQAD
jgi:microsomal dipeptidase-like Zn-dependent dipeptidase